jgi:MYXO-CTERM domain-containing protein
LGSLTPGFASDVERAFAAVPEPSVFGLVALALIGVRRRR